MNKIILACALMMFSVASVQAAGDAAAGKNKALACGGCHGLDGNSPIEMYPKLAGQNENYIAKQVMDFKTERRKNEIMQGMAAPVSEQDAHDIGAYYQSQQIASAAPHDESKLTIGMELYKGGHLPKKIPACQGCHGPTGAGNAPAGYPQLAGQYVSYTIAQLKAFRDDTRTNDNNAVMRLFMDRMTNDEIEAVAHYIASLK